LERRGVEKNLFVIHLRGDENPVFSAEYGTIGIVICYQRRFPENWRIPVLKGAEILFVPAATPFSRDAEMWELMFRIRAYENCVYVVAANRWAVEEDV
jgi:predicted amidohydrolase